MDDLASQLPTQMQSLGSPATSVTGTGSMTIMFAEETLVNTVVDLTFVMVLPTEDGPRSETPASLRQPDRPAPAVSPFR